MSGNADRIANILAIAVVIFALWYFGTHVMIAQVC